MARFLKCGAAACLALTLTTSAMADVVVGGNARSIGMGGAGIAIVDRSGRTTGINPAALALLNRRVKAGFRRCAKAE